jgi:hypothetical protein
MPHSYPHDDINNYDDREIGSDDDLSDTDTFPGRSEEEWDGSVLTTKFYNRKVLK